MHGIIKKSALRPRHMVTHRHLYRGVCDHLCVRKPSRTMWMSQWIASKLLSQAPRKRNDAHALNTDITVVRTVNKASQLYDNVNLVKYSHGCPFSAHLKTKKTGLDELEARVLAVLYPSADLLSQNQQTLCSSHVF
ncbi:hypothetical protein FVE85_9652 [Porphyridium purpureum]|uniref:Uncharacterized protein n=1 Tax=Porphyridium purpureum TaxID=35688 RepID=A0A5J4YKG9_PORPP|nr:hypothetical protein FVE85_9652 [Porphyridium purpureum]|eukprot:POR5482..scf246_12